jgi:hypothetical protein
MANPGERMIQEDVRDRDHASGGMGSNGLGRHPGQGRSPWMAWIVGLVVIAALVIGGFFLFGGDVDSDTEGEFDVQVPEADVDIDGPDVDVETPDVNIDPGSVDVQGGDADAEAG